MCEHRHWVRSGENSRGFWTWFLISLILVPALPNQQTFDYPSFKILIVAGGIIMRDVTRMAGLVNIIQLRVKNADVFLKNMEVWMELFVGHNSYGLKGWEKYMINNGLSYGDLCVFKYFTKEDHIL
ncbi:putative transcription factor B3-Domain family [Helianthus annuus]|nr:putative transcription factor B3-Domain family [Helianthus annuus]